MMKCPSVQIYNAMSSFWKKNKSLWLIIQCNNKVITCKAKAQRKKFCIKNYPRSLLYHLDTTFPTMKVLLPLITLAYLASAQPRCANPEPIECGKDMMNCPGGDDGMGCMMPDTCMPTKGGECQVL